MLPAPFAIPGAPLLVAACLLAAVARGVDAQSAAYAPASPAPAAASRAAYTPAPATATSPAVRLPSAGIQGDPADSLYRVARRSMEKGRFREAAETMRALRARYPKSAYVPDSFYWEAYALSRAGGTAELRQGLAALEEQQNRYAAAAAKGDARALRAELNASLARQGDAQAAENVTREAMAATAPAARPAAPARPARPARPAAPASPAAQAAAERARADDDKCGDEDDVQSAALNGLMQMDAAKAMPVLKKVLARRDPGSECLRRRAVFIVAQQAADAAPILLQTARTDPDPEVRAQAVFWLSQVDSPAAVAALDSILRQSKEADVREKALFALAQQEDPRATQALRDFATNESNPVELREKALFWIGQRDDASSRAWLRDFYRKTTNAELKEKVLFSVAQSDDPQSRAWLQAVVRDPKEPLEVRKKALFFLSQQSGSGTELAALGAQLTEPELREQWVFALAQSGDKAALDRLIEVAKSDKDREVRKKAIFWLGQSDDPRAADVLAKLVTGEK